MLSTVCENTAIPFFFSDPMLTGALLTAQTVLTHCLCGWQLLIL